MWDENFEKRLDPSEYPISIITRTQEPFSSRKIGVYDPDTNEKIIFDCLGEALSDETTGEFLAGMVTCRDVTEITKKFAEQVEKDEQRFQIICNSMPQMIWTTTPDGLHDWFSDRWYEYTGLSEEESLGMGWRLPFHPDDMAATSKRWAHSLATGDPYNTEYRCLSKDGQWRWMLGRAICMRNKETDKIEKWYGTCTDIHAAVESRSAAKRTREQLLNVISHAQVTLYAVDRHRKLTLLEGAFIWELEPSEVSSGEESSIAEKSRHGERFIGQNVYDVFNRKHPAWGAKRVVPPSLQPIEDILTGKTMEDVQENSIGGFNIMSGKRFELTFRNRWTMVPNTFRSYSWKEGPGRRSE